VAVERDRAGNWTVIGRSIRTTLGRRRVGGGGASEDEVGTVLSEVLGDVVAQPTRHEGKRGVMAEGGLSVFT